MLLFSLRTLFWETVLSLGWMRLDSVPALDRGCGCPEHECGRSNSMAGSGWSFVVADECDGAKDAADDDDGRPEPGFRMII